MAMQKWPAEQAIKEMYFFGFNGFAAVLWAAIFIDVRPAFSGLFQSRLEPWA